MFYHSELYIFKIFITNYIIFKRDEWEHCKKRLYLEVKMQQLMNLCNSSNTHLFWILALHFYSKS